MSRQTDRRRFGWLMATATCASFVVVDASTVEASPQDQRPKRRARPPRSATSTPPPPRASTGARGPTRIDFDDRLIQGQTNQSGAVYLFDRKETGISSMVRRRKSFRHLTIETIYDR